MEFAITPGYKDIFKEPAPDINELIKDIPSRTIIQFLSGISAELFFTEHNSKETQSKIFRLWTHRFTDAQKNLLLDNMWPFIKESSIFFAFWYLTEFIQNELANYRDFSFEDTTPEQEYRLLQAYFIVVGRCNETHVTLHKNNPIEDSIPTELRFQRLTWPMLAEQFSFNHKVEPIYQMAKTFVLLRYLEQTSHTKEFVSNYLKQINRNSILHYLMDLLNFISFSLNHKADALFKTFSFNSAAEFEVIFDAWVIDLQDLKQNPDKLVDYKGIREKPLFRTPEGRYFVLNWGFLYNQLNLGLLFSFHKTSGIKTIYKTFPDFRSDVAKNVSEKLIFSKIMVSALQKKHTTALSSELNHLPDFYYRENQYVFLFEFKDVLMPANVIGSRSYEAIKEDIDLKFIENKKGNNKGVKQIVRHIIELNKAPFEGDDFTKKKIKHRNMTIYPIIVYTHFMYGMPGINQYLNLTFKAELKKSETEGKLAFRHIKDVVMIDFEFLYKNFIHLKDGSLKFKDLLDTYLEIQNKAVLKAHREPNTTNIIKANSAFEEVLSSNLNFTKKAFVNELFDALEIKD